LLLRDDRMLGQYLGPAPGPAAGKVAVDPAHARFPDLGDLGEQAVSDARGGVVGVDQHREPRRAVFVGHGGFAPSLVAPLSWAEPPFRVKRGVAATPAGVSLVPAFVSDGDRDAGCVYPEGEGQ